MSKLSLYIRYAMRSFLRGKTRSLFGVFCVAIGVASVVALGLTAGNFRDSVTGDARKLNRGDLAVSPPGMGFSLKDYRYFAQLKARGEITDYTTRLQDDTALRSPSGSTVGTIVGVDSKVFPYYDTIRSTSPGGDALRTLLAPPNTAVVSQDTLDTLHLKVGDQITINSRHGLNHRYTITAVVPDSAVDPFFGAGFWNDFAIVDKASLTSFFAGIDIGATTVYVKTREAATANRVKGEILHRLSGLTTVKTVADVAKDQKNQADGFDKFFHIMGLVAMVIGGIGIINSMTVAARRRTREIAVLKALGMKGSQVRLVFTIESIVLAAFGTLVGIAAGIGTSLLVNRVTENLAGNPIPWTVQPGPLVAGALVGIAATILFSYMPIVAASRAKPVAVLRGEMGVAIKIGWVRRLARNLRRNPLGTIVRGLLSIPAGVIRLPRRQGVRTFLLVLTIASLTGILSVVYAGLASGAQAIIMGAIAGIGALVAAGIITQLFVLLVWIISKLPSFGRLSVRMAFRSMGTQKRRLASTMLALCIGMLSVGSVAILAQSLRGYFAGAVGNKIGYNGVVQSPQSAAAIAAATRTAGRLPGVLSATHGAVSNSATLVSIDGRDANATLQRLAASGKVKGDTAQNIAYDLKGLEARDLTRGGSRLTMVAGRSLEPSDRGTNHITVYEDLEKLGVKVGSTVVFADGDRRVPFRVVGIAASSNMSLMATNNTDLTYFTRSGLTSATPAHFALLYLNIRLDMVQKDLTTVRREAPSSLVLDLSNFTALMNKSLDKMELFPIIIGALALFAGVIIIANTVALAMMERRREIAVMKAVGARRRTILQFLLAESAIVGFLGAAAGVVMAMAATSIVDSQFLKIAASYDWITIAGLLLLGMLLSMGASAVTALPASSERPMTVLRYE